MIHTEPWTRTADERSLRDLVERFRRGDESVIPPLLQVLRRTGVKLEDDILWQLLSHLSWDDVVDLPDTALARRNRELQVLR